nr:MAG TPA: hypothetical protein [Caudoviricetes sp.]
MLRKARKIKWFRKFRWRMILRRRALSRPRRKLSGHHRI